MNESRYFQITRKVTLVNAAVNLLLALVKIIIGWVGFSHALIADGLHSLSDLISDGVVYLAAKMGDQSPDEDHPYGHRRIETLGAIIIAVVLIAVGALIILDAVANLAKHQSHPLPDTLVIVTAVVSIVLNELLYHYGAYYGKKLNSRLLMSNAWHNRSDALTSVIVVVAVLGSLFHVAHLDLIGAALIGVMILYSGGKMIWHCFRELIDTGVEDTTLQAMRTAIDTVPGVVSIHQLRTRSLGGEIFADIHIQVDPKISVSEGHYIADHVHDALMKHIEHLSDVTVHIDPEDDETNKPCAHLPDRPALLAQLQQCWGSLPEYDNIERITIHYHDGSIDLDIYLSKADIDHSIRQLYFDALPDTLQCIDRIALYHQL